MPSDYGAIRAENERKYGTDIGRVGPMLLANRYDDRTHFIYELLQNAEDALGRRRGWTGQRAVEFTLSQADLLVSHFGQPFDDADVRGICGIGESTKDLTAIGRFGIGFKSVYAFSDSPEIHSKDEHFAIDSYVWPKGIPALDTKPEETIVKLPLRATDDSAVAEITSAFRRLGPRTLLFLREINEVSWRVIDGPTGLYLRTEVESLGEHARKLVVIGEDHSTDGVSEETWLVFSREVSTEAGEMVGYAELAFQLEKTEGGSFSVQPLTESPLVVFFPTVVSTNLGFLVQGPFRTTPSRDNIPIQDGWNQHLVEETALLLADALVDLKGLGLLSVGALRSLPLDRSKFLEGSRFEPLFATVRDALAHQPLLPSFPTGHIAASSAKLARTQELRDLVSPDQLGPLFESGKELVWLNEEITQDRTPDLRTYLMEELGVAEVTPESLLPKFTQSFLEAQSDAWIRRLYEFLRGQQALLRRVEDLPVVRLENGTHVVAYQGERPQAFLPGVVPTGFPTVRRLVCQTEDALAFLESLGLHQPDLVDDVIANILPKYEGQHVQVGHQEYQADLDRLLAAFSTDSKIQRDKLMTALGSAYFVAAVDVGSGEPCYALPDAAYQATQRLKTLFKGVPDVLIVDDSKECLRGEGIRGLLEAAGTPLYLLPTAIEPSLTYQEKLDLRRNAGTEEITYQISLQDHTLRGLDSLLGVLAELPEDEARARATLLWEALCDVEDRRGAGAFTGEYHWMRLTPKEATFDATFVRSLNQTAWIPGDDGSLQWPGAVAFESTGWRTNPFLLSKIRFKPPVIDRLAQEAGIEPGVLSLLMQYGLTSVEQLVSRLDVTGLFDEGTAGDGPTAEDAVRQLLGESSRPTPPVDEPQEPGAPTGDGDPSSRQDSRPRDRQSNDGGSADDSGSGLRATKNGRGDGQHRGAGRRKFISYVAVERHDGGDDLDGLDQQDRLALEERAIEMILAREPELQRTPTNNPGFDLTASGPSGEPAKWVEVKAMKGTLEDRPVGLSSTQFECAQEHGPAFWLYVVERAGSLAPRLVRIQDPAGKAESFMLDHGWKAVAQVTDLHAPPAQ